MSAIVATQRIVGGKPAGGDQGLSKSDLEQICDLLGIQEPDKLPTGPKATYLLVLRTSEAIPKSVGPKTTVRAKKKRK